MTDRIRIVYQDRILRITKFTPLENSLTGFTVKESHRYKIEITDGRFFKSWQENYANDEEAIKGAKKEFGNLFDFKGGSAI
ncbi:MAG: hypothetical protein WC628_07790 [Candidatus Omnitrophota bacterium]